MNKRKKLKFLIRFRAVSHRNNLISYHSRVNKNKDQKQGFHLPVCLMSSANKVLRDVKINNFINAEVKLCQSFEEEIEWKEVVGRKSN